MDEDLKKFLLTILKGWKLIVIFAIIGAFGAYYYGTNFVEPKYTSSVKFLAYVQDEEKDNQNVSDYTESASNTSKMNYAKQMIPTYISLIDTNEFYSKVANSVNEKYGTLYSSAQMKSAINSSAVEDTTVFTATVTTNDAHLSFHIAQQLTESVPAVITEANNGLVEANVVDSPTIAKSPTSRSNIEIALIGLVIGIALACVIVYLKDVFDIRIKSTMDLEERYNIPVLGTVPNYSSQISEKKQRKNG